MNDAFGKTVRLLVRPKNGLKSGFIIYGLTILPVLPCNIHYTREKKHGAKYPIKIYVIVHGFLVRQ